LQRLSRRLRIGEAIANPSLMPGTPAACMASSSLSGVFSSITATPRAVALRTSIWPSVK
jgi:hypothetical protein